MLNKPQDKISCIPPDSALPATSTALSAAKINADSKRFHGVMLAHKMKIAVWSNLPTGGARRALHDHITGLIGKGHQLECWRPPVPNPEWMKMPCPEHEVP